MQRPAPLVDVQLLRKPVRYVPFEPFPQPAGAECAFLGRTRIETHPEHGPLHRLAYHAYESMADRQLHELAAAAIERYGCLAVRLHHALGEVPAGAASVLVLVVTSHRSEAFGACRFLIDALKQTTPIWKREQWDDGTTWSEGQPAGPLEPA